MQKALVFTLLAATAAFAQQGSSSQNPVTDNVRMQAKMRTKTLVATAEDMPANKYGYKPTAGNMTFAHLMAHIAQSNDFLCSKLTSTPAPAAAKDSEGKDKLVASLKESMQYCDKVLANINDSELGQSVEMWGGHKGTKAAALIGLTDDWADHYGAAALYLRLNGILPPTARHERAGMGKMKMGSMSKK